MSCTYKVPSMPSVCKKWAQNKQNYLRNKENRREASRTKYWENLDKQEGQLPRLVRTLIRKGQLPGLVIGRTLSPKGHLIFQGVFQGILAYPSLGRPESKRASLHTRYWEDPQTKNAPSHSRYWEDPESKRASSRAYSHTRYWEDPEKGRAASCASSRTYFWRHADKKRAAVRMTNLKAARAKLKWYRHTMQSMERGYVLLGEAGMQ